MDLQLDGTVAVVTASSSGLGKASSKALAREGANVVINGRDDRRLNDAAKEVRNVASGSVIAQPGDITDPDDVSALVGRAVDEFGRLDHLVTSAGGPTPMRPLEPDDDDWHDTFELLTLSVVRLVREAADHLRADGGGSIVTITSLAAKRSTPRNALSSAVRPSVVALENTLSKDLAPDVRVNAVLPGVHDTPRLEAIFDEAVENGEYASHEAAKEAKGDTIPMKQVGDPDAFGDAVAFLCSPRAEHITGAAVPIDGGEDSALF